MCDYEGRVLGCAHAALAVGNGRFFFGDGHRYSVAQICCEDAMNDEIKKVDVINRIYTKENNQDSVINIIYNYEQRLSN